ncbi:MAG: hypothetical protein B6241_10820 [Spirochaetaceae bacterium 4572_59]|nr:MAG: hypothetical protein B6241_10820 [Spirochaetaceae bacterium 4572_59]
MSKIKKNKTKITLQDIADSLGISRGSVDRALHNRGDINQETREKILSKARELGYVDRHLSQFISLQEERKIAVVIPDPPGFFFHQLLDGVRQGELESVASGLRLELLSYSQDKKNLAAVLRSLYEREINRPAGVLLVPAYDPELESMLNPEDKVPLITVNTDVLATNRLCFIGQDLYRSGRLGAELLQKMIHFGEYLCISGSPAVWAHSERLRGISDFLANSNLIQSANTYYCDDISDQAEMILKKQLEEQKNLKGILCLTGAATLGAARCIRKYNGPKPVLVGYDQSEELLGYLQQGVVDALISQDVFNQGYYAYKLMVKLIGEGYKPERSFYCTQTDILLKEHSYRENSIPDFLKSS